jgi:broad specificity phosphatase PhoE
VFRALSRYLGRRVLFVCHGGVMRVVVGLLDGVENEHIGNSTPANAEIVVRRVNPEEWERACARALQRSSIGDRRGPGDGRS